MTSPIFNDPNFGLGSQKAQGKGKAEPSEAPRGLAAESQEAPTPRDDQVTLSEAGRQKNAEAPAGGHRPNDPEQAQRLVEQLKEKIAANPGFAAAVHRVSDNSGLARLLDSFA